MNPVYDLILTRRSCRSFSDRPIDPDDLQSILTAGAYAPSAMNRQTRQFTVLRNHETISRLAHAMGGPLGRPEYTLFNPAALVIVSNDPTNPNSGFDCACALENMFLMAHGLGIGSCWINQMKDAEHDPTVRQMLTGFGVPQDHHVYGMAVLGYAAGPPKPADKSAQVVRYVD